MGGRRKSALLTDHGSQSSVIWKGVKAYIQSEGDITSARTATSFGDVTMLAVEMIASDEVAKAASSKVTVIAHRALPIYGILPGTTDRLEFSSSKLTSSIAQASL